MSLYIQPADQNYYGLGGLTSAQIETASTLIDTYLRRPMGIMWMPNASGFPAYMAGARPTMTIRAAGPIAPGSNIVIQLPAGFDASDVLIGDVVVLDRADQGSVEACTITAYTPTTITLGKVAFNHAGPVNLDFGMVLSESRYLREGRPITRVSEWPIATLLSAVGRYAYTRRSEQYDRSIDDASLLTIASVFGGAPAWEVVDLSQASYKRETGEVWMPAGRMLAYYTEVKLRYVGGYQYSALPPLIQQATAGLALAQQNNTLSGNLTRMKAGGIEIERTITTVLDDDIQRQLRHFRAASLY